MHVYHYAAYEATALKRLTGRHGIREAELDQLLREERFVDLYRRRPAGDADQQGVLLDQEGRGVLRGHTRTADGAGWPTRWPASSSTSASLVDGDASVLDVDRGLQPGRRRSTRELHDWLEERRAELEKVHGTQPRPDARDGSASEAQSDAEVAEAELADRLRDAGHPLLAGLVGWHRREERPEWWDIYRLQGPRRRGARRTTRPPSAGCPRRSTTATSSSPSGGATSSRSQDTKVSEGRRKPLDVDTQAEVGEVLEMDAAAGCLVMKAGRNRPAPHAARARAAQAAGGQGPAGVDRARGADVLAGGAPLGHALLDRRVPRPLQAPAGASSRSTQVIRAGLALDGEVLAIQGPPGSRQDDRRGGADPRAARRTARGSGSRRSRTR